MELDEYLWESYAYLSRYYNEIEQSLPEALAYSKRAFELNENIENVQINYVDNLLQAEQIVHNQKFLFSLSPFLSSSLMH
jgi:hypothetical protein